MNLDQHSQSTLEDVVSDFNLFVWSQTRSGACSCLVDLWLELGEHVSGGNITSPLDWHKEEKQIVAYKYALLEAGADVLGCAGSLWIR